MKNRFLFILAIALPVLAIQTVKIDRPFAGHYASYQGTVMAAMARNMIRENFSEFLYPKTDSLIGGKRSLHMNQYPFPSVLAALGSHFIGGRLEFWGRFQAIVFNAGCIVLIGLIASNLFNPLTGWMSALLYAFSPLTLIYGQSFMSEASSLFFFLLSIYILIRNDRKNLFPTILSGLCFAVSLTGRVHWLVFYPVFPAIFFTDSQKKFPANKNRVLESLIFFIASVLLPAAWYAHTYNVGLHADNIHTNLFMQLGGSDSAIPNLLTDSAYYQKVFKTIAGMLMTPLVFPFVFLGIILLRRNMRAFWLIVAGLAGGVVLIFLAPGKVLVHDFYLYPFYPFLAMLAAHAITQLLERFPAVKSGAVIGIFSILYLVASARYFLHPLFKYPAAEAALVQTAARVQNQIQPEDHVIFFGEGAEVLLYYADRPGWTVRLSQIGQKLRAYQKKPWLSKGLRAEMNALEAANRSTVDLMKHLIGQGAGFFFATDKNELETDADLAVYLRSQHQQISSDADSFVLFKLNR
ncbi:MAG: glycosyltransferase family 39 protein [Candidatus Omnitrophica bacterium]|nr:glycosyltransferase family 39 protein [Candidatus Omnitrophota bacterium]